MTYHIHIKGQVQGVGFRPFIYRLAQKMNLNGWVKNTEDGVHIEVNCEGKTIDDFVKCIMEGIPPQAKIEYLIRQEVPPQYQRYFEHFSILESEQLGHKQLKFSPDFALCPNCKTALLDSNNRRFGYGFITCTNCGPRYSIQTQTPFDRHTTTMKDFEVCSLCKLEYNNPEDVRFYSQTNSCEACGIILTLFDKNKAIIETTEPINEVVTAINEGKIVAIKGIGGYLLLCDATNAQAIDQLRLRKNRPQKPFAVMYAQLADLKKDVKLSQAEADLLTSAVSPIVLTTIKNKPKSGVLLEKIAPNLLKLGVMLPYAPLLCLITEGVSKPLIATSGNLSGAPIIYDNETAVQELTHFADLIVTHNRAISQPQDDSVVQFVDSKPLLLRRSRGYAPSYFGTKPSQMIEGVIALGADLKATIGISCQKEWLVSQYLGNQETYEAQQSYDMVLNHLIRLTHIKPRILLIDKHPSYFTSKKGLDWAKNDNLTVVAIPHHEAHFAAVLQENDLIESDAPVLGVIWDGTGYGNDGNSWGGEFFTYKNDENQAIQRVFHLNYVPLIVGDKMAKEPRISALAFCFDPLNMADALLREKFSEKEYAVYLKMLAQPIILTSSVGRLFDAVASLLGLIDKATYEGEAALYLQHLAASATITAIQNPKSEIAYPLSIKSENSISTAFIADIINDLDKGVPKNEIALKFHYTLVEMIRLVANKRAIKKIAFSGGVFQNSLLVQLIQAQLIDYQLFFHKELSPNDENISFGQLAHYHISERSKFEMQR